MGKKQLHEYAKQQTGVVAQKICTWLGKGSVMRETKSLFIAAQNNAV